MNNIIEFITSIIGNTAFDIVSQSLELNNNLALFSVASAILIVAVALIFIHFNKFKIFENIVIGAILSTYVLNGIVMLGGDTMSLLLGVMQIALGMTIFFVFFGIKSYFSIPE